MNYKETEERLEKYNIVRAKAEELKQLLSDPDSSHTQVELANLTFNDAYIAYLLNK
jgi:hypothetical protein